MKKQLITLSLFLATWTGLCCGADAYSTGTLSQPGQFASGAPAAFALKPAVIVSGPVNSRFLSPEMRHDRTVNRIWISSLVAVAASTSMDAATSWGKREGNGLLADGKVGRKRCDGQR